MALSLMPAMLIFTRPDALSFKKATPNEHSRLWGEIGFKLSA
jgi:hypothetical protein